MSRSHRRSPEWSGDARAIVVLAIPLVLTNFAHVALTTIDVVVLGHLGALDIAAGGLAIAIFNQLRTTGTGLVTSVGNLVAEAQARGDTQRVRELFVAGFFWSTICGLAFVAVMSLLRQPLLLTGQDSRIVDQALRFLTIAAPGMLPCLWFQTLRHFTTGLKCPGPILAITLVSIGLAGGLNYALALGHFGLPALGLKGVALVTAIVFLASFLMLVVVASRTPSLAPYFRRSGWGWSPEAVKAVWRLGLPIAGTYASEAGFFSVLTLIIGTLGVAALAAQTVLNQIIYIVFMISAGLSHAASIHISEAVGMADHRRARRLGYLALALGTVAMLGVAIPWLAFPQPIVALFVSPNQRSNAAILALAASGLGIAAILQVFDAGQNIGNGILRGTGDTAGPFRISLIGYWLFGLPAAWALGVAAQGGVRGIWIGQTFGLAVTAVLLTLSFRNRIDRLARRSVPTDAIVAHGEAEARP